METSTKLVGGWGIKDIITTSKDPLYNKWKKMIYRCKLPSNPMYKNYGAKGVDICLEWKYYSNFYQWAGNYDWEGKEIDKDLLGDGKLYSPDTCCFLPKALNTFLTGPTHGTRGKYPAGVYFYGKHSPNKPYRVQCCDLTGKQTDLGSYSTVSAAYQAYVNQKTKLTLRYAEKQTDLRIRSGLIQFAQDLIDDYYTRKDYLSTLV